MRHPRRVRFSFRARGTLRGGARKDKDKGKEGGMWLGKVVNSVDLGGDARKVRRKAPPLPPPLLLTSAGEGGVYGGRKSGGGAVRASSSAAG